MRQFPQQALLSSMASRHGVTPDHIDEIAGLLKSTGPVTESVKKLIAENSALKKAIEKFASFHLQSPIHPDWGREYAEKMLIKCKE